MKKLIPIIILCLQTIFVQSSEIKNRTKVEGPNGFSTVAHEMSGGGKSEPVHVKTLSALEKAVESEEPKVIVIVGTIKTTDKNGYPLNINSNKTIIGANKHATIYGGISIKNKNNIIVRNLNIQGTWPNPGPDDTISIRNSHHIWLNHLNIWDAGDGLLDITRESSYVTVSWCKFWYTDKAHQHRLCALIGSGGGDHPEDWGKLKVTYHHNWFADLVDQRMPRVVYGQAHIYNNYYTSKGNSYCIGVGSYGSALVENNYFQGVKDPHKFMYDVFCHITATGNKYEKTQSRRESGIGGNRIVKGQNFNVEPLIKAPYNYKLDQVEKIPELVKELAGPQ